MKRIRTKDNTGMFKFRVDYENVRVADVNTRKFEDIDDTLNAIKKKFGGLK